MKELATVSAAFVMALGGCASTPGQTSSSDPYENFNRSMFALNTNLDKAVLKPVAKGYRAVTTKPIRSGISNALSNLREPITFVNEILQGEFENASNTVGRFAINSTLGVAGFADAAGSLGVERTKEDFGQTLAVWGIDSGPYLVLPIINSTNFRDLLGSGVDSALQPLNYAQFDGKDEFLIGRTVVGTVSSRESVIELVDEVMEQQADPYTALRRNHVQSRGSAIRNGQEDPNAYEDLPDEYWDE